MSVTREMVAAAIARGKVEIAHDISAGFVPEEVAFTGFSELHDYVDANYYGGLCDPEWFENDAYGNLDDAIDVQTALGIWIANGMPPTNESE